MNTPKKINAEIAAFFNQQSFVDQTITQINKDLQGLYFDEFIFKNESNSNEIIDQLVVLLNPILVQLSKGRPEQLSQFIYRVDLGEKKYIDSISFDLSLMNLSYLVIEREAQKVYLRMKFK